MIDHTELRKLAEAATPGVWRVGQPITKALLDRLAELEADLMRYKTALASMSSMAFGAVDDGGFGR